jgi:hypothetical protein
MRRRAQPMYRGGYRYSRRYRGGKGNNSGKSGNNSGKSGNTTNGQRTSRPPAYFPNPMAIQQFDVNKEYKRDDFVTSERKDVSYIVLADSVTGKEPKENPTEFKEIPAYEGSVDKSYNEGDLIIFGNDHIIYQRIDSSNPELPYQAGQDPDGNPYAWLLRAIHEGATAPIPPSEYEPKKGNNSGKMGNNSGKSAAAGEIQDFDKVTIYNTGDLIRYEGKIYRMTLPFGSSGYDPSGHPDHFVEMIEGPNGLQEATTTSVPAGEIQDYDNFKAYSAGDLIRYKSEVGDTPFEGKIYKMTAGIGAAGYAPPGHPDNFVEMIKGPNGLEEAPTTTVPAGQIQDYDNFKAYKAGDLIRYKSEVGDTAFEGKIYKMTAGIGAAGYDPPGHPDNFVEMIEGPNGLQEAPRTTTTAEPPAYDDTVVYKLGDVIKGPDGKIYKMIDGIGLPGYPPPRPTNWELVTAGGGRRRRRTRNKRRRGSRRH